MEPNKAINAPLRELAENRRQKDRGHEEERFKEAVCIDAARVYDSCEGKDCLEDLQVYFEAEDQDLISDATGVRLRNAEVIAVIPELEPVSVGDGFYSVDATFYFRIDVDLIERPNNTTPVRGLAVFSRKVILFGGEGSVKIFNSQCCEAESPCSSTGNLPKAIVQVAEPVRLAARLIPGACFVNPAGIPFVPPCVLDMFPGLDVEGPFERIVLVTIGIFSIIQIERPVQLLIPAYDFCFPAKSCTPVPVENPCNLFRNIDFPIEQFFPARAPDGDCD